MRTHTPRLDRTHRRAWRVACALLIGMLAGCEGSGDWSQGNRQERRAIPPSGVEAAPRTPATSQPADVEAEAPHAVRPVGGQTDLLRIDLVSGVERDAAESAAPRRPLRHVSARPCGRVLEMLYPPLASGGSQERYYLIYEDGASADAAAAMVGRLDQPAADGGHADSRDPHAAFRIGVTRLMDVSGRVVPPESSEIALCVAALRDAQRADVPLIAWAAALLAGRVQMDLRFDGPAARAEFERAVKFATAGSIEEMMALWATAESYKAESASEPYLRTCARIVSAFDVFHGSHIYQRARTAAGP